MVRRNSKTHELGYKVHVTTTKSDLPLAIIVASVNENEKKHASRLFDKALRATREKAKTLVADSQYSSGKLRIEPQITE